MQVCDPRGDGGGDELRVVEVLLLRAEMCASGCDLLLGGSNGVLGALDVLLEGSGG